MAKKFWVENIENPAVLYQEENPGDSYTDKTADAVEVEKYGESVIDFWFLITILKSILIPKCNPNYPTIDFSGWDNLTGDEKKTISRIMSAPYSLRVPGVFSDSEDIENARILLTKSYGLQDQFIYGRLKVVENMRMHVFLNYVRKGTMSLDASKQFGKDTAISLDIYERFATSDFYDWLTNKVGTIYESDGFEQKVYWSQDLEDELISIYNGQ